jgi:hypothetical protein
LCLAPGAAAADVISFDMNSADLAYVDSTKKLTVSESAGADLLVRQEEGAVTLDTAKIVGGGDFDLSFALDMVDEPGIDQWSATGTLTFTDTSTATDAVIGSFTSTAVGIAGLILEIQGTLHNDVPSILQNRGSPWVFVGEETIPGEHAGDGLDGTAGQITVSSPGDYDDGAVFVLKVGVGSASLDTLFGDDFTIAGGEVIGDVTPEPATMSLLALGGLIVLKRKRRI